jgi:hypothetical protein
LQGFIDAHTFSVKISRLGSVRLLSAETAQGLVLRIHGARLFSANSKN